MNQRILIAAGATALLALTACETPVATAPARPAATTPAATPAPATAAANAGQGGVVRAVLTDRRIVIVEGNREFTVPAGRNLPTVGQTYTP